MATGPEEDMEETPSAASSQVFVMQARLALSSRISQLREVLILADLAFESSNFKPQGLLPGYGVEKKLRKRDGLPMTDIPSPETARLAAHCQSH